MKQVWVEEGDPEDPADLGHVNTVILKIAASGLITVRVDGEDMLMCECADIVLVETPNVTWRVLRNKVEVEK